MHSPTLAVFVVLNLLSFANADILAASADSAIRGGTFSNTAFPGGTSMVLMTPSNPSSSDNRMGLVQFTNIPKTLATAELMLSAVTVGTIDATVSLVICRCYGSWSAGTVTWNNRPTIDTTACITVKPPVWSSVSVDVKTLIVGSTVTFALMLTSSTSPSNYVEYYTTEGSSSNGPKLSMNLVTKYNSQGYCPGPQCIGLNVCNCQTGSCLCPQSSTCCECNCGPCADRCLYYDPSPVLVSLSSSVSNGGNIDKMFPVPIFIGVSKFTNFTLSSLKMTNCVLDSKLLGKGFTYTTSCTISDPSQPVTVKVTAGSVVDAMNSANQADSTLTLFPATVPNPYNIAGKCYLSGECKDTTVCQCTATGEGVCLCNPSDASCSCGCNCGSCAERCALYNPPTVTLTANVHTVPSDGSTITVTATLSAEATSNTSLVSVTNCGTIVATTRMAISHTYTCRPLDMNKEVKFSFAAETYTTADGQVSLPTNLTIKSNVFYNGQGHCLAISPIPQSCADKSMCECIAPSLGRCLCSGGTSCCSCGCGNCVDRCSLWAYTTWDPSLFTRTELVWSDLGISTTLPSELGLYTSLVKLDLSINGFSGTIPTELGRLRQLQSLNLKGNALTGPIPTELGRLTKLTSLVLTSNLLDLPVPPEVIALTSLTTLEVDGYVPPEPQSSGSDGLLWGLSALIVYILAAGIGLILVALCFLAFTLCRKKKKGAMPREKVRVATAKGTNNDVELKDIGEGGQAMAQQPQMLPGQYPSQPGMMGMQRGEMYPGYNPAAMGHPGNAHFGGGMQGMDQGGASQMAKMYGSQAGMSQLPNPNQMRPMQGGQQVPGGTGQGQPGRQGVMQGQTGMTPGQMQGQGGAMQGQGGMMQGQGGMMQGQGGMMQGQAGMMMQGQAGMRPGMMMQGQGMAQGQAGMMMQGQGGMRPGMMMQGQPNGMGYPKQYPGGMNGPMMGSHVMAGANFPMPQSSATSSVGQSGPMYSSGSSTSGSATMRGPGPMHYGQGGFPQQQMGMGGQMGSNPGAFPPSAQRMMQYPSGMPHMSSAASIAPSAHSSHAGSAPSMAPSMPGGMRRTNSLGYMASMSDAGQGGSRYAGTRRVNSSDAVSMHMGGAMSGRY